MATLVRTVTASSALVTLGLLLFMGATAQPQSDFFAATDANRDGQISREELQNAVKRWLGGRDQATVEQLTAGLNADFPDSTFLRLISPPASQTPKPEDVQKMMASLPESAPAKPSKPRKVLVLSKCAGFVHSCIPLAAKTIEELGQKTGAWSTTVSYDSAVITAENLKQYDALLLNNTTGAFLDDPDPAVTAARKKALLDFVRGGKGLVGIHAASDAYHRSTEGPSFTSMLGASMLEAADKNQDKAVDAQELGALADAWFEKANTAKTETLEAKAFQAAFPRLLMGLRGRRTGPPPAPRAPRTGPDPHVGTWPEFNTMIGGFFKWHWNDPQHIVYKIDDPESPLTSMFRGGFEINDETYTFGIKSWSRENLRVLASVDYDKMSDADKAKEEYPRSDHDYGLSWVRREGKGRVFYAAHGHSERAYAVKPFLQHLLAGIQYAIGDLKAKDSPSAATRK